MNMKKEIQAEIRLLTNSRQKIIIDCRHQIKVSSRAIRQCESAIVRARKNSARKLDRIQKRISILEGRLS